MHLQDHVGQRLRLSLCLCFLQLLLYGGVSGNRDIGLPEVLAIRKSADLFRRGQRRRCWYREARFTGNLWRTVGLRGKNRCIRTRLLICARICCWNMKEYFLEIIVRFISVYIEAIIFVRDFLSTIWNLLWEMLAD